VFEKSFKFARVRPEEIGMAHGFFILIIALIVAEMLGRLVLAHLNIGYIAARRGKVPPFLEGRMDQDAAIKAADYSIEKLKFGELRLLIDTALLIIGFLIGFFSWAERVSLSLSDKSVYQGIIFLFILGAVDYLLGLPFNLYSTFRLEKKYGFNRTTPKIFIVDQLKAIVLSAVIGAPLFALVSWIFNELGSQWWIYTWLVLLAFSLIMTWIYPEYIAPLFNKFEPLNDPELLTQINDLSRRTGFNLTRVQVMDASRRSSHSNAYFTGFGKTKKIVLFDTLINQIKKTGIISVLAHELGHFKLKHVIRGLVLSQVTSFIALAALAWMIQQTWFYEAFGLHKSLASSLFVFGILSDAVGFWWTPLASWISRRHEFQADHYAVKIMGEGENLKEALVGLAQENLSAPQPHPAYSKFYYSHPPLAERLGAIDKLAGAR